MTTFQLEMISGMDLFTKSGTIRNRECYPVLKAFYKWAQANDLVRNCRGESKDKVAGMGVSFHSGCCDAWAYVYKGEQDAIVRRWLQEVATDEQVELVVRYFKLAVINQEEMATRFSDYDEVLYRVQIMKKYKWQLSQARAIVRGRKKGN